MGRRKPERPVRLIHLADMRFSEGKSAALQTVLDEIQLREPWFDGLLVTGDIAAKVDRYSYQKFVKRISAEGVPVYGLPCENDDINLLDRVASGELLHLERSVEAGNWKVLFLDRILGEDFARVPLEHIRRLMRLLDENPETPALILTRYYRIPKEQLKQMSETCFRELNLVLELISTRTQVKALVCAHAFAADLEERISGKQVLSSPPATHNGVMEPGYRRIDLYPNGQFDSDVVLLSEAQRKTA